MSTVNRLVSLLASFDTIDSQSYLVEPGRTPARSTWYWQNVLVQSIGSEAFDSSFTSVCSMFDCWWSIINCINRYSHSRLLEINSHSLFSRWFSESGKLVQRLFNGITELVDEDDSFIVVLIGLR